MFPVRSSQSLHSGSWLQHTPEPPMNKVEVESQPYYDTEQEVTEDLNG